MTSKLLHGKPNKHSFTQVHDLDKTSEKRGIKF